jgi:L-threonylcarbamoyladenylate synthase
MLIMKADQEGILRASKVVAQGGIVVYPTDTVYGVGCDPFNEISVRKVIEAKQREGAPLPVLGSSVKDLQRVAWFSEKANMLASKFWPGPLTLILLRRPALPDFVTFGLPTVGVRLPDCDVALRLIELSGGLLVGTSANLSGGKSCTTAWDVVDQIGDRVDLILDGGETALKKESTVARLIDDEIELVRYGAISENEVRSAFRDIQRH